MREALMRAAALTGLLLAAILVAISATITSTLAQAPTQAQRAAIKSQCRSDYMAHCSSIAPGGAASLQCLQKNMASLAPGCQAAVQAVTGSSEAKSEPAKSESKPQTAAAPATEPTAESKAEPAPAATAAAPATAPASKSAGTKKPSNAQVAAIRSACRSDYPKVCAGVPTGGAQALQCLEKNKAKLSAACEKAVAAATDGSAASAAASTAAPATANASPDAAPLVLRPMLPREVLFVARSACGADVRALCAGAPIGGGRIIECLASQPAALSPSCRDVQGRFAAR